VNLIEMQKTIDRVSFPGVKFSVEESTYEGPVLVVETSMPNSEDPSKMIDLRIRSYIPPCPDVDVFLSWLTYRLCRIASHEVREWLRYDGVRVSNPHEEDEQ
jgi:hypothetical protein